MMQALAILNDSLRHLRSRSLFWITLVISALVAVVLFGTLRFNETGWSILWFEGQESDILFAGSDASRELLAWLFGAFVFWWLSWGAIILALISTASVMPDFVESGAIDLTLARPLGRIKLYALKILGALLFMLLQVTISTLIAYFLMGLRFGMWFHAALWAIPLLTIQFLYLYAVSAGVGLWTRSPLASLLVTLLFWGTVSIVQFTANQVDSTIAESRTFLERYETRKAATEEAAASENRELAASERRRLDNWQRRADGYQQTLDILEPWQGLIQSIELTLPKTADVQKIIADQVEAPTFPELLMILGGLDPDAFVAAGIDDPETARDMQESGLAGAEAVREVNAFTSLATSLLFTALVLAAGTWVFMRRDF